MRAVLVRLFSFVIAALFFSAVDPSSLPDAEGGGAEADSAVQAARDALSQSWSGPPWYDAENDAVRSIEVKPSASWSLPDWRIPLPDLTFLEWLMWAGMALVLAAIVYLLIRAYLSRESYGTRAQHENIRLMDHEARVEALPFRVKRSKADLLAEATDCHRAGDYNGAIVYLFSYLLVELDRTHHIRLARGKTNRRYLGELSDSGRLHGLLEHVMLAFEDVFFGNRSLERQRFEKCWNRLDEFHLLIGQRAQ